MITSSSVGSASPSNSVDQLVAQFRASERKPIIAVENKKTTLTARLSVLGELKTRLETLFSTVKDLSATGTSSKFSTFAVSSTLTGIATATATSSAIAGTHTLLVTQLAKSDSVLSSSFSTTATDIVTAAGTGVKQIQIGVNGTNTPVNVTLNTGDTNSTVLSNIATAINASGAAVSASVVSVTSSTSRLVLTSKTTGLANAISLSNVSGTLLDGIGLTAGILSGRTASTSSTAGFAYTSTASLDANFKLDGIDIVRGTNSVSDALTGVTLELKGTQLSTDAPVTLKVGIDKDKIKTSIEKFIKDYNDALSYITEKTSTDANTRVRQILAGDMTFNNLRIDLRTIAVGQVTSVVSGNPKILSDIGITAASNGTLSISDSAKFDDALTADVAKVADLFNSTNGIAVQLQTKLDGFVSSTGIVQNAKDGVNDSIKSATDRIDRFNERLDRRANQFRAEYLKALEAIAKVQQQQQSLQGLLQ